MMLSATDLLLVAAYTAACTAAITVLAVLTLRLNRRRSIRFQLAVVVLTVVAAIVSSTAVIAAQMYVSEHDLTVLLWVIGVAAVMSIPAALLTTRTARATISTLRTSVERVGQGDVVAADTGAWKELADVSTQLAETSEHLAAARAEIEQLDASRRELFAWISHDLRTPLTGISALAEALEEDQVTDPADYVRQIRAQVRAMSRLVDDLFALSQIHSGTLQLRREHVELLDIVSGAVADVAGPAATRGLTITPNAVAGHTLWADPHELNRVIVNLLMNSIRHAPPDSEILITATDGDGGGLLLSVLDAGEGVPPADLSRMFEVGWRENASRTPAVETDGTPGAGLGLAIVRGIVEAHGGSVSAEHAPDGFRLNVALPAEP
ncbi:sensor histidine kinase [Ruania zhangjianzhongii]|uniref:sensor histidine kinase n=1 Tax=Ruania zhangjianzhongii TaxID=2603206 RepID=UPI0016522BAD|nr:HAMP domain-containing sensor histidine kinase [Ruania zhangjianzhongii]